MSQYTGIEKKSSPSVSFEEVLAYGDVNSVIVDTRTPKEYNEAHVYGAMNMPLMSDYQRHIVGKTYHHESKEAAISKGWEIFSPIIQDFLNGFEKLRGKKIFIYCWRGGMRSRIVVNLLNMNGYDAIQISGGYKQYINAIVWNGLEDFAESYGPKFIVLVGGTGTRKTEILKLLHSDDLPVLDLEGLAGHKGSLYGSVDSVPNSQKMFSILLYHRLDELKHHPYVFVEAESNKIGDVHVPKFICAKIANDVKVRVNATVETRVAALKREYLASETCIQQLHQATKEVAKFVGQKRADMLHKMLDDEQYDEFAEWLLLKYYDQRYKHTNNKGYDYRLEISSDDIDDCCDKLTEFYQSLTTKQGGFRFLFCFGGGGGGAKLTPRTACEMLLK